MPRFPPAVSPFARVVLLVLFALPVLAGDRDTFERTFAWQPGLALAIDLTMGDVRVVAEDRADIRLVVTREAPSRAALDLVPAAIADTDELVALDGRQPDDGRDRRVRTSVSARVPRALVLRRISVYEGDVRVEGVAGGTDVRVERGSVTVAGLEGRVRIETVVGDVTAERISTVALASLHARVFNGDVRLGLAARPANLRLLLLTLHGRIDSALPVTERAAFGPTFAEGTFGSGTPVASVDVVRGDVTVSVAGRR